MIRLLKRFVDWLDARFPPKVYLKEQDFKDLHIEVAKNTTDIIDLAKESGGEIGKALKRIVALEDSIAAIKETLAKQTPAAIAANRRAEFISAGRLAD